MRRLALAAFALLLAPPALRAQGFALQDGDRVVFYGDSPASPSGRCPSRTRGLEATR